jgi:hypothetical protein
MNAESVRPQHSLYTVGCVRESKCRLDEAGGCFMLNACMWFILILFFRIFLFSVGWLFLDSFWLVLSLPSESPNSHELSLDRKTSVRAYAFTTDRETRENHIERRTKTKTHV